MAAIVSYRAIRAAGLMGVVAAVGSLAVRLQLLGEDPGTERYEELNSIWLVALAGVPLAVGGLYVGLRQALDLLGHAGAGASFVGAALAAAGNAVEFQFGNEQGFMLFGLGLVVLAGGMLAFGASARRMRALSMRASAAMQSVGVLAFFSSIAGPIGIVASLLVAAVWVVLSVAPRPATP